MKFKGSSTVLRVLKFLPEIENIKPNSSVECPKIFVWPKNGHNIHATSEV